MEAATLSIETFQPIENESFWKHHLELQKASGLTRAEYCRNHEINYARFGYWLSKWSCETSSLVAVKLKLPEESPGTLVHCTLNFSKGYFLKIHTIEALSYILERMN